jgi:hypothetical protein
VQQRTARSAARERDGQIAGMVGALLPAAGSTAMNVVGAPAVGAGPAAGATGTSLLDTVIANTPRSGSLLESVIAQTYRDGLTRASAEALSRSFGARAAGWLGRFAGGAAAFLTVLLDSSPTNSGEAAALARMRSDHLDAQRLSDAGVPGPDIARFQDTRRAIQDAARTVLQDPNALDAQVAAIQAQNPALRVQRGDTVNVGSNEMNDLRDRARELQQTRGLSPADAMREAAGELHSRHAASSDRELNRPVRYSFDRESGTAFVPGGFTIAGRAPNLNDPAERALVDAHNRAVLEEVTHAAGFAAQPGQYTPLSPRTALFEGFMRSDEGRRWAQEQGFTPQQVDRFLSKIHEADVVDVFRDVNPMSRAEIDRYPERQAFERFVAQLDREIAARRR